MTRAYLLLIWSLLLMLPFPGAGQKTQSGKPLYAKQNLVAWCIVPFDKMQRTPGERVAMLRELGITQFAYDWRHEHLPSFEEEIRLLKKNNIALKAVWFWVDGGSGKTIDDDNRFILETLRKNKVRTELWLSFNDRFFTGLSDSEKFKKAAEAISAIDDEAKKTGCSVQLYNHGSWFGEPQNQVKIIQSLKSKNIGMVYNFHHARHQIKAFPDLIALMKPYLTTVNINGMKEDGPMIMTVGEGNNELSMLQHLKDAGYQGSIGILGHVDDEDVRVVLQKNLDGLKSLLLKMEDKRALETY